MARTTAQGESMQNGETGVAPKPMPERAPVGDPKVTAFGHAIWLMTHSRSTNTSS